MSFEWVDVFYVGVEKSFACESENSVCIDDTIEFVIYLAAYNRKMPIRHQNLGASCLVVFRLPHFLVYILNPVLISVDLDDR